MELAVAPAWADGGALTALVVQAVDIRSQSRHFLTFWVKDRTIGMSALTFHGLNAPMHLMPHLTLGVGEM